MKTLTKIILFPLIGIVLSTKVIAHTGNLLSTKDNKSLALNVSTWVEDHDYLSSILAQALNVSERMPSDIILEVPASSGEKQLFRFFETSVMHHY
mgnify:FL=1